MSKTLRLASGSRTNIAYLACRCACAIFPASGRTAPRSRFRVRYPEPWFPSAVLVLWFLAKKHWSPHGISPNPPTPASPNGVQLMIYHQISSVPKYKLLINLIKIFFRNLRAKIWLLQWSSIKTELADTITQNKCNNIFFFNIWGVLHRHSRNLMVEVAYWNVLIIGALIHTDPA